MTTWTTDPTEAAAVESVAQFVSALAQSLHTVAEARYTTPAALPLLPAHSAEEIPNRM
ncbi:hypothetical protein [Nocardia panacis]|uniref:hypothetical protein n=1 Tax=Nocardia panacis TaxID=2340916 RepID=UPI001315160C|nr:hypothetical protein [Nocardia panacis]